MPTEQQQPQAGAQTLERVVSLGGERCLRVTFSSEDLNSLRGGSPKLAKKAAWRSRVLQDLQEETHFSSTELEVLLHHFQEHQKLGDDDLLDRETFFRSLGAAFGTDEQRLLQAIYAAMDQSNRGWISFSDFVSALSTIYRGDKDDVLAFWFKMYDSDRDGFLDRQDFQRLLQDVNRTAVKAIQVYVDEEVFPGASGSSSSGGGGAAGGSAGGADIMLLSFEEFKAVMDDFDVLPIWQNPHKFAQHKQAPALRSLTAAEREVLLLLGSDISSSEGHILIQENDKCTHFYFLLEGEVSLQRGGVTLGTLGEGSFVGEAALFGDIKAADDDGSSPKFTTAVSVVSPAARLLRLHIGDFYPLVYHQHPGATAIVQRLGRIMLERFQQTEERLQAILQSQARQSEAGVRLSSKDWAAFRQRLTRQWALRYHKIGRTGKLEVVPTKLMGTKEDLSVAYSPGVAEPCLSIQQNEKFAYEYTAKGHLVGVVTNGTAVLGLGNIGAAAAKPVMEGKAVLFKKFADLDAFDIELDCPDPVKLVDMLVALQPTFGGINLEDIKAPECFYVEKEAQRRMSIPVFHDDQHGTAVVAGAGLLNALELIGKDIGAVKVVVCGCGAAGFTCAKYFVSLGVKKENLLAVDIQGVVYEGREDLTPDNYLNEVAVKTDKRSLKEAVEGADVFLGVSAGNLLKPDMLLSMAKDPIVFACANPTPEIDPETALATRSDVIMCTGRSDYPNQINNVIAFPPLFRGALDCRAKAVNEEMKKAATYAIAALAKRPVMRRRQPSAGDLLKLSNEQGSVAAGAGAPPKQDPSAADTPDAAAAPHSNGTAAAAAAAGKAESATSSSTLSTDTAAPATASSDASSSSTSAATPPSPFQLQQQSGKEGQQHHAHHPHHARCGSSGKAGHLRRKSYGESAYYEAVGSGSEKFSRTYVIPKPFDERLLPEVAAAVLEAAIASGVARLTDIDVVAYKRQLADLSIRMNL